MYDVIIAGAGIAGMSAAWYLQQAGKRILLLDAHKCGQGTSWAAAGMLAPVNELEFQEVEVLQAGVASLELWHQWAREFDFLTLNTTGTLDIALGVEDIPYLQRVFAFQQQLGLQVQWLEGEALQTLEPALSRNIPAAVHSRTDIQLEHREFLPHFADHLRQAGVDLREHCPLHSWTLAEDGTVQVQAGEHSFTASQLLLATGSAPLPGTAAPVRIYPIRGQMISVAPPAGGPLVHHNVRIRSKTYGYAYLAPKPTRIILGSTTEEMGQDTRLTAGGMMDILRKCYHAVPGIYDLNVLETWSGLRPATLSRHPVLDALPGTPQVFVLNGLYRHGILLGPLMGRAAAQLMTTGHRLPAVAGFTLAN
ncbi:MAG: FAD-dependent oxidoreductase [Bacteroidetes bacterium]|nr:FAD-dependent oxidoreductase [Bacteroidota bacterium]